MNFTTPEARSHAFSPCCRQEGCMQRKRASGWHAWPSRAPGAARGINQPHSTWPGGRCSAVPLTQGHSSSHGSRRFLLFNPQDFQCFTQKKKKKTKPECISKSLLLTARLTKYSIFFWCSRDAQPCFPTSQPRSRLCPRHEQELLSASPS